MEPRGGGGGRDPPTQHAGPPRAYLQGYLTHNRKPPPGTLQGYLAHKKQPPSLGPPYDPRYCPTVGLSRPRAPPPPPPPHSTSRAHQPHPPPLWSRRPGVAPYANPERQNPSYPQPPLLNVCTEHLKFTVRRHKLNKDSLSKAPANG